MNSLGNKGGTKPWAPPKTQRIRMQMHWEKSEGVEVKQDGNARTCIYTKMGEFP
jgi:hypothetical protein